MTSPGKPPSAPSEQGDKWELERRIFHLKTLYDVSQEIVFLRDSDEIARNLLMMVMGTFGSLTGLALSVEWEEARIYAQARRGMEVEQDFLSCERFPSQFMEDLLSEGRIRVLDGCSPSGGFFGELAARNVRLWVPMRAVQTGLVGGIGLGAKITGEPYTDDDRELLGTLASQGAMTLQNAKLLEQMKREVTVRTNLARYLSPQVVEQVINRDLEVNLGGARKVVTVLFSDIRHFTRIMGNRPADQLIHILNEYFTEMARIIFACNGSLDKYIGDAIVAVFGSLIEIENPTRSAAEAAVQMMRLMPSLNEKWSRDLDGFSMEIGIGINTGEVFLGNIGSPERMEFTVIGDTVNVASRFSGLARAGQILLTEEAVRCLGDGLPTRELAPSRIKGKTGQEKVFKVLY